MEKFQCNIQPSAGRQTWKVANGQAEEIVGIACKMIRLIHSVKFCDQFTLDLQYFNPLKFNDDQKNKFAIDPLSHANNGLKSEITVIIPHLGQN